MTEHEGRAGIATQEDILEGKRVGPMALEQVVERIGKRHQAIGE